jgi:voltage-dependent anion channel protein 2
MSLFKDLGKPAKDLLCKNYSFGEHKIELSSSAGDASFDTEWSSKGKSKVETHYKLPNKASLDVECGNDSTITGTLKMKQLAPGLVVKAKTSTRASAFLGLEYTQNVASLTADIDYSASKGPVINASAILAQNAFTAGGSLKLLPDSGLADYALGLGYGEAKTFDITAKLSETIAPKPKPLNLLVQYIHYVSPSVSYGASFSRTISDSPSSATTLGGTYKTPQGTKVGLKIDSASKLGAHVVHEVTDNVTFIQSFELDVSNLASPHKYGFNLKFKH